MANEIIRPAALPVRTNPVPSEVVPSDNNTTVAGVTWENGVNAAVPPATQMESEAGVINTKRMTPLTTKQAIDAQVPPKISSAIAALNLGSASQSQVSDFATAAQGALADTAVQPSRTVSTGAGLTGGGTLATDQTIALNPASIAALAKADTSVQAVNGNSPDGSGNVVVDAEFTQEQDSRASALLVTFAPTVKWVRTAGYEEAGDGGGALYKRTSSEPSHAGKFQSADGAWWELSAISPNAFMFGAKGDGTSNDSASLNSLANYCAIKGTPMMVGAGVFFCGTTGIDCTGVGMLCGAGRQDTRITFGSAFNAAAIRFNISTDATRSQQVEICHLTVETAAAAQGTGIRIEGLSSINSDRTTNRLTIRDVFVTGKVNPMTDGFNVGVLVYNVTNALIDGYSFRGKVNSAGEASGYDSSAAISYDGNSQTPHHCALTVSNSFISYAKVGISAYDFEGVLVQTCQIIGVDEGAVFASFVEHPHASVVNSHINASTRCIEVVNVKQVIISNNALYSQIGAFTGTHIRLDGNSSSNIISGNVFENLKTSYHTNSVVLRSAARHTIIYGNVWHRTNSADGTNTNGVCVWFQTGSSWNKAPEAMNIYNDSGTYALDQGTGNLI